MAARADVDDLLAKMRVERARLIDAARSVPEDRLAVRPPDAQGEDGWSVLEQLSHLLEMERAYDAWVRACVERDSPDLSRVRPDAAPIPLERAHDHSREQLVDALVRERERTEALIGSLDVADFDRVGTHPMFGSLTVLQWLRSFYRHDRMHQAQIEGREPDYRPRYAGGREPDQRRR